MRKVITIFEALPMHCQYLICKYEKGNTSDTTFLTSNANILISENS